MKTLNVRYGFATNSSSSHSIVYVADERLKDIHSSWDGEDFGWSNFTLADPKTKLKYLASTLLGNLEKVMSFDMARCIVRDWCDGEEGLSGNDFGGHAVDHESLLYLPMEAPLWRREPYWAISKSFFMDFKEYVMDPHVVILGGNDNDDPHPLSGIGKKMSFPKDYSNQLRSRKDGDWWTIFNTRTGFRHTFSFLQDPAPLVKFDTPLLVDLKITNWCDKGCNFCYQDSTPDGIEGDAKKISNILYHLAEGGVFEVAIGGGEPTSHPKFVEILEYCHSHYITPNFTTKSLKWMEDKEILKAVQEFCGGFAYSPSNSNDIKAFIEALKNFNFKRGWQANQSIHLIPELLTPEEFEEMLRKAHSYYLSVTLLGLKNVGRGESSKILNPSWVETILALRADFNCPSLSVDTDLARRYPEGIAKINPNKTMWFTEEGGRSMYIDAVTSRFAPSSYSKPEAFKPLPRKLDIFEVFKQVDIEN